MYNERKSQIGFNGDRKKSSVGFSARKNSHKTYGSITEQAHVSGGFAHEGHNSRMTRKTGKTKKVGIRASDFDGPGSHRDMRRLNYGTENDRDNRDDISDELSVGFKPHPEYSDEEEKHIEVGYLSDNLNVAKRQAIERVNYNHPSTAGRSPRDHRLSEPVPRGREPPQLRTLNVDQIENEYEDIGYNVREYNDNLHSQIKQVKRIPNQGERLDEIAEMLGRLKEDNDSRAGDFE